VIGGWIGKQIAIWSRGEAAKLMLEGNRIVLQDVGTQSARFLEMLEQGATSEGRREFFAGLRPGPTERHGQDRLATAFRSYLTIVYIRLEPYIRGAMPFIVPRCATQRLMTYEIGETILTVGEHLPGVPATAARNWTQIEETHALYLRPLRKVP
jgi:hypothetical protein